MHHLERLRARSPCRHQRRIPRRTDQSVGLIDERGMHAMARFNGLASGDNDVELVLLHSLSG
jgi:hypothetical protein